MGLANPHERPPATSAAILAWLVGRIAAELRIDPRTIDVGDPFARYGIDSVAAAELSVALEDWIGRPLSPTLLWDLPSLEAIATSLAADA